MPLYGQKVTDLIIGQTYKLRRQDAGLADGDNLTTVSLAIVSNETDGNADAIYYAIITPQLSDYGLIEDTGENDGDGSFYFVIPKTPKKAHKILTQASGTNNVVKFEAVTPGQDGNNLTVEYEDPGLASQTLAVVVDGKSISISLATDGAGVITTTAANVIAAINADSDASALVLAAPVDVVTGLVVATPATNLTNGNGGTDDLIPSGLYFYYIYTTTHLTEESRIQENGRITPRDPRNTLILSAGVSTARAANYGPRMGRLVDEYADTILHDFRQLRVWDELARRSAQNSLVLRLTYKNWNPAFLPEVIDGQNEPVDPGLFTIDYDNGTIRIADDDGDENYYVTYEFNLFPPFDLANFANMTLQEVNLAGAAEGGFITKYSNVEQAPEYWDAPITFGMCAKAFNRLAVDSGLWKNYLIWVSDNNGPGLAKEASAYYQALFDNAAKNVKKLHFIAAPSAAFQLFESVGFGSMGVTGSKFRELRINRVSSF